MTPKNTTMQLTKGFVLQEGKYVIESVLGQGSFGITYLATTKFQGPLGDISVKVAIKEFFARDLNLRHPDGTVAEVSSGSLSGKYAKDFQREAKNLSSLKHPNIINVLEAFSENNTHYYVMEYLDGGNLDDYIQSKGRLNESEALDIASQMASALSYMHSHNMLHLDLKPKNVMRRSDGTVCLIDFGLSKQYESSGEPESSTTIGLGTPGYAPLEQGSSDERKNFAPTLDIYALGASIFKMLTGKTPPRASDIMNDGFPSEELEALGVSPETIQMIERLMSPRKKDRPQQVDDCFLSADFEREIKDANLDSYDIGVHEEETKLSEPSDLDGNPNPIKVKKQTKPKWPIGLLSCIIVLFSIAGIKYFIEEAKREKEIRELHIQIKEKAISDSISFEEHMKLAKEEKTVAKKAEILYQALQFKYDENVWNEYLNLVKQLNGIRYVEDVLLYIDEDHSYENSVTYSFKDNRYVVDSEQKTLDASKTCYLYCFFGFVGFEGIEGDTYSNQTFTIKIINPDGTIHSSFDDTVDCHYYGDYTKVWLSGWGSPSPGLYKPGTYKYELYSKGRKLFSLPITFK